MVIIWTPAVAFFSMIILRMVGKLRKAIRIEFVVGGGCRVGLLGYMGISPADVVLVCNFS